MFYFFKYKIIYNYISKYLLNIENILFEFK